MKNDNFFGRFSSMIWHNPSAPLLLTANASCLHCHCTLLSLSWKYVNKTNQTQTSKFHNRVFFLLLLLCFDFFNTGSWRFILQPTLAKLKQHAKPPCCFKRLPVKAKRLTRREMPHSDSHRHQLLTDNPEWKHPSDGSPFWLSDLWG